MPVPSRQLEPPPHWNSKKRKGCQRQVLLFSPINWNEIKRDEELTDSPAVVTRYTPNTSNSTPVTVAGNTRFKIFAGINATKNCIQTHTRILPIKAPYASGHGSFVVPPPPPSTTVVVVLGHFPVSYNLCVYLSATGIISNVGPTTLNNPEPRYHFEFPNLDLVICKSVAIPLTMKPAEMRYSVDCTSR